MKYMEVVRKMGHGPITITSGYRSPAVNRLVGGVPDSDHALGHACDFYFPKWDIKYAAPELAASLSSHPTLFVLLTSSYWSVIAALCTSASIRVIAGRSSPSLADRAQK